MTGGDAETSGPIGVLVADDHPEFRAGVRALLSTVPDVDLLAEVSSGEEAIARCPLLQPDVVLMDLNMPGVDGIEATRAIVDAGPHIAVVVLTMYDDQDLVFAALRAGARGYLLKGADRAELVRAVRTVAGGGAVFGPEVARRVMGFLSSDALPDEAFPELTEREREVLERIARGHSNQAIATELVVTAKTVRNHVSNIFGKLQVRDRAEAIVRAREAGMGRERGRARPEGGFPHASGPRPHDGGTRSR